MSKYLFFFFFSYKIWKLNCFVLMYGFVQRNVLKFAQMMDITELSAVRVIMLLRHYCTLIGRGSGGSYYSSSGGSSRSSGLRGAYWSYSKPSNPSWHFSPLSIGHIYSILVSKLEGWSEVSDLSFSLWRCTKTSCQIIELTRCDLNKHYQPTIPKGLWRTKQLSSKLLALLYVHNMVDQSFGISFIFWKKLDIVM